jgi:hypothetical protein
VERDLFEEEMQILLPHIEESIKMGDFEMSNRKPFNVNAGYVASKINPLTGIANVIYVAAEAGIDAEHKYVTVCEKHGQMISSTSIPNARIDMKDASQWCSVCQNASHIEPTQENAMQEVVGEPSWLEDKLEGDELF